MSAPVLALIIIPGAPCIELPETRLVKSIEPMDKRLAAFVLIDGNGGSTSKNNWDKKMRNVLATRINYMLAPVYVCHMHICGYLSRIHTNITPCHNNP
jgi:hypothetical protein